MAVTVADVRTALGEITVEELPDTTITQKIADAAALFSTDKSVRDWAAWKSFLVSRTYTQMKLGPLSATRKLDDMLADLKATAMQSAKTELGTQFIFNRTLMYDDRKNVDDEGVTIQNDP